MVNNERNTAASSGKNRFMKGLCLVLACVMSLVSLCLMACDNQGDGDKGPLTYTTEITPTHYADIVIEEYGTITVALDGNKAPKTVENFVKLANEGFYDGLTFHRIMENFMMQGGDPEGDGTGGQTDANGSEINIQGEFIDNGSSNNLSHIRGAISMARATGYNTASSQFFIVHQNSLDLDGQYAVFGYVTSGIEVVDLVCRIATPVDDNGTILRGEQPVIASITVRNA